jgi:hypothetical protein
MLYFQCSFAGFHDSGIIVSKIFLVRELISHTEFAVGLRGLERVRLFAFISISCPKSQLMRFVRKSMLSC